MHKSSHSPSQKPLTNPEIQRICQALQEKDPWYYQYFQFALHTGMRRGEILALTWHDVDLWKHRELTVPDPKRPRYRPPSARRIPVDEFLLGLLLDLRSPVRWVFQKTGRRMLGGTITIFFRELSRSIDIPVTSERIRLTFAARLYQDIAPETRQDWKQVQKRLGHKDLSTTKNYYLRNLDVG